MNNNKNSHFKVNRSQRSRYAEEHTQFMEENYQTEMRECIFNTKIYDEKSKFKPKEKNENEIVLLDNLDSVSALFQHAEGKTAVLNFSSYKNPGGGFLNGSQAQEEALCHESFLYNVLKNFQSDFYDVNKTNVNQGLYTNKALYSPNVVFVHDNQTLKCDVITCAAPNLSAYYFHMNKSQQEIDHHLIQSTLRSRIQFIIDIAKENHVDTLILGAYGCGVFKQNPADVAKCFSEEIGYFKKVVFAVPGKLNAENYNEFKKIFGNMEVA